MYQKNSVQLVTILKISLNFSTTWVPKIESSLTEEKLSINMATPMTIFTALSGVKALVKLINQTTTLQVNLAQEDGKPITPIKNARINRRKLYHLEQSNQTSSLPH